MTSANGSSALEREERYHDNAAGRLELSDLLVEEPFTANTAFENSICLKEAGNLDGKRILDLGCGAGEAAVYFATRGARVCGTDISEGMLALGRRLAQARGVRVEFLRAPAEKLPFPDEAFDLVYGNGILHHADKALALPEVARVMADDGMAFFIEPLAYNPVIEVYRRLAGTMRSPDERPVRLRDLKLFRRHFGYIRHREVWFFALYLFLWFYLVERAHPSKERYWKKVLKDGHRHRCGVAVAGFLDRIFLGLIPPLRFMCWNTVVVARRPLRAGRGVRQEV